MKLLKDKILTHFPLNKEDVNLLNNTFYPINFPAGTILKKEDSRERYIYFLMEGVVKGYHFNDGKAIVEHLINSGRFAGSFNSFISEAPNKEIFETITDCKALRISKTDFELLSNSGNKWNSFIQNMINDSLNCKLNRVTDFQTKTAKQRYLDFMDLYPDLVLSVSIEDIASYLGMEKQSLSRIRGQLRK